MRIENLSKEVDMTAVHGGGDMITGVLGSNLNVSGGLIGVGVQVDPVTVIQLQNVIDTNTLINFAGSQAASFLTKV